MLQIKSLWKKSMKLYRWRWTNKQEIRDKEFYRFLRKLLEIDPKKRYSASEALRDPFFKKSNLIRISKMKMPFGVTKFKDCN